MVFCKRSLAKTVSFRILATIVTLAIVFVFTGSLKLAGTVGLADVISKSVLYYFHEIGWSRTHWGRN